uniref:39S ribosomal protein L20, mitochondrial n=1 Tax=Panagrellus redivivus TaxID=6233 RepID=A0A7E4ZVD1_PANRE
MRFTDALSLRRIINSSYHPFHVIPKPSIWPKRERLRRFIAWQYGSARTTVRNGTTIQNKIFHYMDMQRQDQLKNEIFTSEQRLNAALAEHHLDYARFRSILDQAHILLDNIVLAQLAVYEPRTFKSLVDLTKKLLLSEGRTVLADDVALDNISVDSNILSEPFPKAKYYPRGPAQNHTKPPRKLREEEF